MILNEQIPSKIWNKLDFISLKIGSLSENLDTFSCYLEKQTVEKEFCSLERHQFFCGNYFENKACGYGDFVIKHRCHKVDLNFISCLDILMFNLKTDNKSVSVAAIYYSSSIIICEFL